MENTISYDVGCLIYPGTYVPLMKEEEVISALNTSPKNELVLPLVNITELSDSYKIELATPGVKREDFLIHADENTLSIVAVHKQNATIPMNSFSCMNSTTAVLTVIFYYPKMRTPNLPVQNIKKASCVFMYPKQISRQKTCIPESRFINDQTQLASLFI